MTIDDGFISFLTVVDSYMMVQLLVDAGSAAGKLQHEDRPLVDVSHQEGVSCDDPGLCPCEW